MEIPIGIEQGNEADRFLRALWAEFRRSFGKCSWQYTPFREGEKKMITFGFADLDRPEGTIRVGVSYATRGSIRSIHFNYADDSPLLPVSELGSLIERAVAAAREASPTPHPLKATIEGLHAPPWFYQSESFRIEPVSRRRFDLWFNIPAFDATDATTEFLPKLRQALDVLSVETNSAYWPLLDQPPPETDEPLPSLLDDQAEAFVADPEWIDGYPVQEGRLLLSAEGKQLLGLMLGGGEPSEEIVTLLRACGHFHTARKYDAQVSDVVELGDAEPSGEGEYHLPMRIRDRRLEAAGQMGAAHAEITGVLYMSALEVAAKIGAPPAENCAECGQLKYKISRRVTDLLEACGGRHLTRVAREYYGQRSQYLHEGMLLTPDNYSGTSVPQLDPTSPSGCRMQVASPSLNLREYVGFCLRKVLKQVVARGASGSP